LSKLGLDLVGKSVLRKVQVRRLSATQGKPFSERANFFGGPLAFAFKEKRLYVMLVRQRHEFKGPNKSYDVKGEIPTKWSPDIDKDNSVRTGHIASNWCVKQCVCVPL
jgi:hypothetical protein